MQLSKNCLSLFLAFVMLFSLAFASSSSALADSGNAWTIYLYLCGTDLESDEGDATDDIIEILDGTPSENVTVLVQTGGTREWNNQLFESGRLERYVIRNGEIEFAGAQFSSSMGNPSTLSSFLSWGEKNYPAEKTGLIFWDHGSGSINGVCFDEMYDYESLLLRDISDAIGSTGLSFEFIGFDACLMSTFEAAAVLSPYANWMYASEETESGYGWYYTPVMDYLAENPGCDGQSLGRVVLNSFFDFLIDIDCVTNATFSVTDLSEMPALVDSFEQTAQEMLTHGYLADVVRAALKADNFGGNSKTEGYTNMIDLGNFLENAVSFAPSASDTLDALESAVVIHGNGPRHTGAYGLSMYYPLCVQGTMELPIFADICPCPSYLQLVRELSGYDGEAEEYEVEYETGSVWDSDCPLPVEDVFIDEDGIYTIFLENTDNLAYASCCLYLDLEDGDYLYLGEDDDAIIDYEYGIIEDNFDGSWICMDSLLLPIQLIDQYDTISMYTCPVMLNGKETNMRISYDWDTDEFEVLGTWDGVDSETGMTARDIEQIKDGDTLAIIYYFMDEDGEFYEFTDDEYVIGEDISLDLYYDTLPDGDYYYGFNLYDIYGGTWSTDMIVFNVEDGGVYFYE